MPDSSPPGLPDHCPASALVMAARSARTPLAIADAQAPGAPILFANEAFAAFLGLDAAALAGVTLASLRGSHEDIAASVPGSVRLDLSRPDGRMVPAAMTTAPVAGADGAPLCLLCSLMDASGDNVDAAVARDATLLAQVAQAAAGLLQESASAEQLSQAHGIDAMASDIALGAVERAIEASQPARA